MIGLGEFVLVRAAGEASAHVRERLAAEAWPQIGGARCDVAWRQVSPAWLLGTCGDVVVREAGPRILVGVIDPAGSGRAARIDAFCARAIGEAAATREIAGADAACSGYAGRAAFVVVDAASGEACAVTDRMRTLPLYVAAGAAAFATDLRLLAALIDRRVDVQAIYHYLNFGYVPTPFTPFEAARKLPPGTCCTLSAGAAGASATTTLRRYWRPTYPEDITGSEDSIVGELSACIHGTVHAYRPEGSPWGTFLSGGTDSSSISGILARQVPRERVTSFSIGYTESAYDELDFARVAASAYGLDARFGTVSADDTLALIERLPRMYDEPFANASAVPTYYCAALAGAAGMQRLIAGDGGDEVFGGNERYAKDAVFAAFHGLPGLIRRPVAALVLALPFDQRHWNRVRNFVHRASLSNPERFYSDDAFASVAFDAVLTPTFRAQVARDASLELMRRVFDECDARSELNRLLYLDLHFAIADSDLVKVNRATRAAGVAVHYPYLDPELVTFTGRLRAAHKVRGLRKRYLFKKAMAGVLPPAILAKRKQGFGVPIADWFARDDRFRSLVHDVVLGSRSLARGYIEPGHVRDVVARHERGAWDHAPEIWMLLMLELWHRAHVD
jgi:asparagine synthase (glutamine-hydrolysing)